MLLPIRLVGFVDHAGGSESDIFVLQGRSKRGKIMTGFASEVPG